MLSLLALLLIGAVVIGGVALLVILLANPKTRSIGIGLLIALGVCVLTAPLVLWSWTRSERVSAERTRVLSVLEQQSLEQARFEQDQAIQYWRDKGYTVEEFRQPSLKQSMTPGSGATRFQLVPGEIRLRKPNSDPTWETRIRNPRVGESVEDVRGSMSQPEPAAAAAESATAYDSHTSSSHGAAEAAVAGRPLWSFGVVLVFPLLIFMFVLAFCFRSTRTFAKVVLALGLLAGVFWFFQARPASVPRGQDHAVAVGEGESHSSHSGGATDILTPRSLTDLRRGQRRPAEPMSAESDGADEESKPRQPAKPVSLSTATDLPTAPEPPEDIGLAEAGAASELQKTVPVAATQADATAANEETLLTKETVDDGAITPEPKPDWLVNPHKFLGGEMRRIIEVGPYKTLEECRVNLDQSIDRATLDFLDALLGTNSENMRAWGTIPARKPFTNRLYDQLGINKQYVLRNICKDEYVRRIESTSVGPMLGVTVLLELDDQTQSDLRDRWKRSQLEEQERRKQSEVRERFAAVGAVSVFVLALVGVVWGFFTMDTATKGFYTKRLILGAVVVTMGAGLLSAVVFESVYDLLR